MSEHPDFPQETAAMRYIVDQVSRIEDAQACGTGYYKSLSKVLQRLDTTDTTLVKLNANITDLKKITDFNCVAGSIDNNTTVMSMIIKSQLDKNTSLVQSELTRISSDVNQRNKTVYDETVKLIADVNRRFTRLEDRVFPPLWKIYGYCFLALCVGVGYGHYIWR